MTETAGPIGRRGRCAAASPGHGGRRQAGANLGPCLPGRQLPVRLLRPGLRRPGRAGHRGRARRRGRQAGRLPGTVAAGPLVEVLERPAVRACPPGHPGGLIGSCRPSAPETTPAPPAPFFARQVRVATENSRAGRPRGPGRLPGPRRYRALETALTELTPARVVDQVVRSGLRGGAAPATRPGWWTTVAKAAGEQKYVICNADEVGRGVHGPQRARERPPSGAGGHGHRRLRRRGQPRLRLLPGRVPAGRGPPRTPPAAWPAGPGYWAPTSPTPPLSSRWSCAWARACFAARRRP